jgi:hypothetical protein
MLAGLDRFDLVPLGFVRWQLPAQELSGFLPFTRV